MCALLCVLSLLIMDIVKTDFVGFTDAVSFVNAVFRLLYIVQTYVLYMTS